MQIPAKWNVFPILTNTKAPPLLKNWETIRYNRDKLKTHKGNYALGTGDISGGIIVFDWDFRHDFNRKKEGIKFVFKEFKEKHPNLAKTLICETPHGYHFYYQLKGKDYKNTKRENGGYSSNLKGFKGYNDIRFSKYLKGFDTRANEGYVIIPPSEVDGNKYEWKTDYLPLEISQEEYKTIFDFFIIKGKDKTQNTMRKGFIDILNGKINPNIIKNEALSEHVYWKETFHEAYSCCGLLPSDLLKGLAKFQVGFDLDKTKQQLNNPKNIEYILNGKRLSKKKYEIYFPDIIELFPDNKKDNLLFLEGMGYIHLKEEGLFLEKTYKSSSEYYRILEGKLELQKISYETLNNNRILLTGTHGKKTFRTYPLTDLLNYLNDYIFYGNKGRDVVKYYIHKTKENIPEYELNYVLGFNSHWSLPMLEEEKKFQLLTATDKQKEAYLNAKEMVIEYSKDEKVKIRALMQEWLEMTQMKEIKLSIIIGWSMSAPFRYVFINKFALFPILCAYGSRSTGKSSILESFIIQFYDIYENYDATRILFSSARFEDVLSMSSFPVFIQEVNVIPLEILSLIKEHTTGISKYFRKRTARENDFNCLKSAPLAFDCNKLPKVLADPAMNTKAIMLQFTEADIIELNPKWNTLRNKLKKLKLFSLMYDYTKDWTDEDVEKRIDKYIDEILEAIEDTNRKDIEKDNPRIIQHYVIIAFGIDLFNDLFETNFKRKKVIQTLLKSRTIMTQNILNDFYAFCDEATYFETDRKNPNYLNHRLENYTSKKKGKGYLFNTSNKSDFQRFTQEKYSLEELTEQLRDALNDKEKYCISNHNTGKIRGVFVHEDFFDIVKGVGKQKKVLE